MSTMRAISIKGGKGPATSLFMDSIAKPVPVDGQAIVKIKAFGLNRMDLLQREGQYPLPPQAPETMGVEFSGIIEEFGGKAHEDFKVGDEVFGLAYGGAYAEYIAVSTKMLVHKPKQLSWEEAAGVPETWITASQALFLIGDFQEGQTVLWHAGASSVSISGIQLAKAAGAKAIYATVGSQEKIDFLEKELGVTKAFNYKTQDWAAELQKEAGAAGVNLTVDFIGGPYFQGDLDVAAKDGRVVFLGMMGGGKLPDGVNLAPLLFKRVRVEGSTLRSRDEDYQARLRDTLVDHALPKFCDGTFRVFVEKVFPFDQIMAAHQLLEANTTKGKIICVIE
ncbi:quinone oxidoreductase [Penicillium cosmopolitanum]|uniref:Quinone oxidoreductase n=1 Tax=Penicillium cosmopolitanum TaxID=1131564 RepID=A0A9W9W563_9EURO|nr:quinone oxidoreductase [Penicillium cosmopolitanum]KAJ5403650.1 quinone oxidoreductase [Penicillium cosmopolitanum]